MDKKPKNGCEIQNSCCGVSGILLHLKIVKLNSLLSEEELEEEENSTMLHGTKLLIELVHLWSNTDRVVCANSYFASKPAADTLLNIGL